MIYIIIGTRAQLIKMAPIIRILEKRNWPFYLIGTGQHKISMDELKDDFEIKSSWKYIANQSESSSLLLSIRWFSRLLWKSLFHSKQIIENATKTKDIVLVHGDTLSTVIGALIGRLSGANVAHVESGLRSFNLLNPFPEELNRLITFKLSDIAFCPDETACGNLVQFKSLKTINTSYNTIFDSLHYVLSCASGIQPSLTAKKYAIISIHRFENIYNKNRLKIIIDTVHAASQRLVVNFVMHPVTQRKLEKSGFLSGLKSNKNINLIERLGYIDFISMLKNAHYVITDGGSNQEELSYLGIPTLLMRNETERNEGLNKNIVISKFNKDVIHNFLDNSSLFRNKLSISKPETSASSIVADEIAHYAH